MQKIGGRKRLRCRPRCFRDLQTRLDRSREVRTACYRQHLLRMKKGSRQGGNQWLCDRKCGSRDFGNMLQGTRERAVLAPLRRDQCKDRKRGRVGFRCRDREFPSGTTRKQILRCFSQHRIRGIGDRAGNGTGFASGMNDFADVLTCPGL